MLTQEQIHKEAERLHMAELNRKQQKATTLSYPDMTVEDAAKLVISAGLVYPPDRMKNGESDVLELADKVANAEKERRNQGKRAIGDIESGEREDHQRARCNKQKACDQAPDQPMQPPSGIGGQLHCFGTGEQHA